MSALEDRPTLPERYARAIESTHLEVVPDERSSVDMLIAAGWCTETLGTELYRLRAEFDAVRAAMRQGARNLAQAQADHRALLAAAANEDGKGGAEADELARWFRAEAEKLENQFVTISLTAKALTQLKTLRTAREALLRFADLEAVRQKLGEPGHVVDAIAANALDAWLDPLCQRCEGRGFNGGFGVPLMLCTHCGGTRLREIRLGPTEARHQFGRHLLVQMDRMTDVVTGQMRRFLSTRT